MQTSTSIARSPKRRWVLPSLLVASVLMLLAAACSSSALSEDALITIAVAEQNQESLNLSEDLASTELLDGKTGAITTLGDVITGDRAILVCYWRPN